MGRPEHQASAIGDRTRSLEILKDQCGELTHGGEAISSDAPVAKLSVVGVGMRSHSGVAGDMFRLLAEAGINIQMISTSEIKISALVARSQAREALQVVHRAFGLDKAPSGNGVSDSQSGRAVDAADVVARLQGMEDLTIDDITAGLRQHSHGKGCMWHRGSDPTSSARC